jgi:hypothetical protein
MLRDDYPPRLCRATSVQKGCKGDQQVTGAPITNPLTWVAVFWALVALCIVASSLLSSTIKVPPTLTSTQITEFRKLHQTVQQLDRTIADLDRELIFVETSGDLAKKPGAVEKYYQQLSKLYELRMDRTRYAQDYNSSMRIHFSQAKTSPLELTTAKGGFLPTGIR